MMTSQQIRQSFLDFFREKQHTIVPSSSLLPDAPNLLFTNAGMNQFVPIFLGQVECPYDPPRAADTQKCIRAGGKHNDLEDVGMDTYHHTLFEMLGNWSFGDYFKEEAIEWAWELVVGRWKFPAERVYATYFGGDDKVPADTEARDFWLRYLPPDHVLPFGRKDNFWMMGDTGPCGPCSEIHIDLSPNADTGGKLVNAGSPLCIEIWNLVFIQFNANPDGSLTPLAAKHVDTGMGFERVCGMIQCTDGLKDFTQRISNYETDVFRPIFQEIEKVSGKRYGSTLPADADAEQVKIDIAFRVIADHIRCLSLAIADGILPSNEGRGYVLRRILRRAVRYGRSLGFHDPFFYKLVDVVGVQLGGVFPELERRKDDVRKTLRLEEESFNRTLDRGIDLFEQAAAAATGNQFPAEEAFKLYDTYGFPIDLTELMARERGLTVDTTQFGALMEEQRKRSQADYHEKKTSVVMAGERLQVTPTTFVGFEQLETAARVEAVVPTDDPAVVDLIFDRTTFYAEKGGQVGDTGSIQIQGGGQLPVVDTQPKHDVHIHRAQVGTAGAPRVGQDVQLAVDAPRRANIQRHHTVTHLFHWALHEVVSRDARQKGSLVAPDRLRFDFNQPEKLSEQQLADIEQLVNQSIRQNETVHWFEVPYAEVRGDPRVMQVFGDKYGEVVRVVQIGGSPGKLDGFSVELCGGTHTRTTGEIGLFKITRESAVAAGIRRVEALAGNFAAQFIEESRRGSAAEAERAREREQERVLAKQRQAGLQQQAPDIAKQLLTSQREGIIAAEVPNGDAELLRSVVDALKQLLTTGVVVLGGVADGKVALICYVSPDQTKAGKHAGKIIGAVAKICGGGGGGRPDVAQAGAKQPEKLAEALAAVPGIVRSL